ncbi:MAG: TIGR00725 family protein [Candidatus Hydrothermarchaeota archaeon]
MQVSVIGSGEIREKFIEDICTELGELLAENGFIVLCGGLGGVMEAVSRGVKKKGGITVGILPGSSSQDANPYIDIKIVTAMSHARNAILVRSGDVVISVSGGAGTLSEIALAVNSRKEVIAIESSGGISKEFAGKEINGQKIHRARDAKEAVDIALRIVRSK